MVDLFEQDTCRGTEAGPSRACVAEASATSGTFADNVKLPVHR